ncbi:hypothetical protein LINGRAHAP2_LOCUS19929, partial [Linum grandiflorum]
VASALPNGLRIVVTCRGVGDIKPAGDTLSFIGRYWGAIGRKTDDLPIYFKDWRLLDKSLKERVWIQYIKVYWKNASTYILSDLGSKWAKHRRDLFDAYCDEKKSKPENFANVPPDINAAHWAAFVTNRLDDNALLRKLSCGSQPSSVVSGSSSSSPSINLSLDAYQRLTEDLTEKIT